MGEQLMASPADLALFCELLRLPRPTWAPGTDHFTKGQTLNFKRFQQIAKNFALGGLVYFWLSFEQEDALAGIAAPYLRGRSLSDTTRDIDFTNGIEAFENEFAGQQGIVLRPLFLAIIESRLTEVHVSVDRLESSMWIGPSRVFAK